MPAITAEDCRVATERYFLDNAAIIPFLYDVYRLPGVGGILPDGWDLKSPNVSQSLKNWLKVGTRYDTVALSSRTGAWIPGPRSILTKSATGAHWNTDSHLEYAGNRCVLANELVCITRNDNWQRVTMYVAL